MSYSRVVGNRIGRVFEAQCRIRSGDKAEPRLKNLQKQRRGADGLPVIREGLLMIDRAALRRQKRHYIIG